jgi:hypothetical protein
MTLCSHVWYTVKQVVSQDDLYKKAMKALFKLQKDFLSLNANINTALDAFDHTFYTAVKSGPVLIFLLHDLKPPHT